MALRPDPSPAPLLQGDLLIDALFGTGLTRPLKDLENLTMAMDEAANNLWCGDRSNNVGAIVAVDLPSGTCSDSGRWLASADHVEFCADLTVTFAAQKLAHVFDPLRMGKVVVVDIGLRQVTWLPGIGQVVRLNEPDATRLRKRLDHKFDYGHALILSGPPGHTGAARLSARGALRIGAGLVTVACPPEALAENAARLDAVMLKTVPDGAALAEVLQDTRINALCLGPGLGLGQREAGLVAVALGVSPPGESSPVASPSHERQRAARPLVLDADALTLISRDPALFAALHDTCILTPHAGEFARLFPDIAAKLAAPATKGPAYSKVDATREAAARAGCVVLYKGHDTVIADPTGRCAINSAHYDRAAPWLATAGSGDVLAGFITGLLARGFSPFDAACTGAWLHVECARSFGPGLIAEDLPEELPKVFRALGL